MMAAFAVAMVHQLWVAAALGWPDATLAIAIVLALPMVNALEHTAQRDAVVAIAVAVARHHGWDATSIAQRIVGHDAHAVWTPANTSDAGIPDARGRTLWGHLGRKVDPTGTRADRQPILSVSDTAARVALALGEGQ
jgi:hypothetical protein